MITKAVRRPPLFDVGLPTIKVYGQDGPVPKGYFILSWSEAGTGTWEASYFVEDAPPEVLAVATDGEEGGA